MGFKIVVDSVCDTNEELATQLQVTKVPLSIYVGDHELRDDDNLDIRELLHLMKSSPTAPKTASPSPQAFVEAYEGEDDVFVVTVSSQLSSTYSSAVMAKETVEAANPRKFIHVFDSMSASVGETLVSLRIFDLAKRNLQRQEIIEKVNEYIRGMKTFFLLDSMDNLVKSGRMSKAVSKLISVLSLRLVMGSDGQGNIKLFAKARGAQRALGKLIDMVEEHGERLEDRILGIAHCNCREKAEKIKEEVLKRFRFKDVIIVEMAGVAAVYANEGGVVIAF